MPTVAIISLCLTAGLFILSLTFRVAGKIRLTIPIFCLLLFSTVLSKWAREHETKYGNYVCVPNFEIGCYLSSLDDLFFNTEVLSRLLGDVDGITVATAIKYVATKIYRA